MNSSFQIVAVQKKHLKQIVTIAKSQQIKNQTDTEQVKCGFLISNYEFEDYLHFFTYIDHFYAAQKDNELIGFVLAYSDYLIKELEWLNVKIKTLDKEPFILIKQICISREYKRKEAGLELYKFLFKQEKNANFYAVIVIEPLNLASINFHEKLGFVKQFEILPPDGLKRAVWKKGKD